MVEACIGLSLMAFVWSLSFYAAYMVNQAGKCAVASRHAAWARGNGATVSEESLRGDLFDNNRQLVRLRAVSSPTSDASGQLSGTRLVRAVLRIFPAVQQTEVSFGLRPDEEASTWPFTLMNSRFPFMPESRIEELLRVSSSSEWDTVSNKWDTMMNILQPLINQMFDREDVSDYRNPPPLEE